MPILNIALLLLATVIAMECASWAIHKYILHGPLWVIHQTHHRKNDSFFELNDVVSLGFGALAVYLLLSDWQGKGAAFWVGAGISLYGILYFILHDLLIHRRWRFKGYRPVNIYLKGIVYAHRMHHKSPHRDGSEAFGLLWASIKYFKAAGKQ